MYCHVLSILLLIAVCSGAAVAGLQPRIVDGTAAKPGEIPFQVSLQTKNTGHHFCGGSILNKDYVITAAHCVSGKRALDIVVVAGVNHLDAPNSVARNVSNITVHENYSPKNSWLNDIALLKVSKPFVVTPYVKFVPMPSPADIAKTNDTAIVSGFGRLRINGPRTRQLYWAKIQIADQRYCSNMYRGRFVIYPTQVCAYEPRMERGGCKGDSGGPLMVNGKLAGLVSWSHACAHTKYPSVYTRVTSYTNWIKTRAV